VDETRLREALLREALDIAGELFGPQQVTRRASAGRENALSAQIANQRKQGRAIGADVLGFRAHAQATVRCTDVDRRELHELGFLGSELEQSREGLGEGVGVDGRRLDVAFTKE
jgi:hypothetical protein